jgi:hypothetical protein
MAKEVPGEKPQKDTTRHAQVSVSRTFGKGDRTLLANEGIFLSKSAMHDVERGCKDAVERVTGKRPTFDDEGYYRGFISEGQIEQWYHNIQADRQMRKAAKEPLAAEEYAEVCHPGTDTEDPEKSPRSYRRRSDDFNIDRSRSTAQLGMPQSTGSWLNGSGVKHRSFISMQFHSPDGRDLLTVYMTPEQFASFLCSNTTVPCTMDTYWSVTDECVRLREVVKKPDTIHDRMEKRLDGRLDEMKERLEATMAKLNEKIQSGKAMSKTQLAEIVHELEVYQSHFDSNRDFTVLQAREEVSSIVEAAAASIAFEHRIPRDELLANSHVQALVRSLGQHQKQLPEKAGG